MVLDSMCKSENEKIITIYKRWKIRDFIFYKCTALDFPLPRIFKTVGASFHSTGEWYIVGSI